MEKRSSYISPKLLLSLVVALSGCSTRLLPWVKTSCTIRAEVEEDLIDYIKARYDSNSPKRFGIIPFDMPENFYSPGNFPGSATNDSTQEVARRLQIALLATGELGIFEVFDRGVWPRKRDEFFRGNYAAIDQARSAGYDFVIVGMLEPLTNDSDLVFHTKVIDLSANMTVFSGTTTVNSNARAWDRDMQAVKGFKLRQDLFEFKERFEKYARCTADYLVGKRID